MSNEINSEERFPREQQCLSCLLYVQECFNLNCVTRVRIIVSTILPINEVEITIESVTYNNSIMQMRIIINRFLEKVLGTAL